MKSLICCILALGLAVIIALSSCAPKEVAAPRQEVRVEQLGSKEGTTTALITQVMADVVSKNHPWIRITVTETLGVTDGTKMYAGLTPEQKKFTFCAVGDLDFIEAKAGKGALADMKTDDLRFISVIVLTGGPLISLNPNIKTWKDIAGKRVDFGPRGSTLPIMTGFYVYKCWGIQEGQIRESYLPPAGGVDALVDGRIDVWYAPGTPLGTPLGTKYAGNPAAQQVYDTKQVSFIEFTKEDYQRGIARDPAAPWSYYVVSPGAIKPGVPPAPQGILGSINFWGCSRYTDEEVVYEVTKTLLQKYGLFKDYHAAGTQMAPETMVAAPFITEADIHPGALRAYKEFGVKIGR